jgi:hypothetical protein
MKAWRANAIVVAVSLTVSFAVAELVLRKFAPVSDTSGRFLMFSSPHFRLDDAGAVRYIPNEDVRSISVYDRSIEYDVHYHTNNLGFIDDRDYGRGTTAPPPVEQYAIVGNSFTAGIHGGRPWIPALRAHLSRAIGRTDVYNLGIEGTGVQQFVDLVVSFARERPFTQIVVVAISNDFQRSRWQPLTTTKDIRYCEREALARCKERAPIATVIGYHDSEAAIIEHTRRLGRETAAQSADHGIIPAARALARHSHLLRRLSRFVKARSGVRKQRTEDSFAALVTLREHFPTIPITFIHLPEKEEVQLGAYLFDPAQRLRKMGMTYYPALQLCRWSSAMYLPRDNHPNGSGYQHVEQCVLKLLLGERAEPRKETR